MGKIVFVELHDLTLPLKKNRKEGIYGLHLLSAQ